MTDNEFREWENDVFGFGYGTGEQSIMQALHRFFSLFEGEDNPYYRSTVMEQYLGHPTTWLLINALCRCDAIEYGTSPRNGWVTPTGKDLRET